MTEPENGTASENVSARMEPETERAARFPSVLDAYATALDRQGGAIDSDFAPFLRRVSKWLRRVEAAPTGGAPTEEAVVRKMVANISDHYLAKLSCGSRRLSAEDGICHPREEHERVMVATFCGFLGFDVKDK